MSYQYQSSLNTHTQSQALNSLSSSVASLRSSLSLLDSSISILDAGISDFPRLKTVLASTRHFELTPSTTLATAQSSLASELSPAITTLLHRAESHVAKLERKQASLIARSELLEGRLSQSQSHPPSSHPHFATSTSAYGGSLKKQRSFGDVRGGVKGDREARLKALRQKKERLAYAVERLQLQSQQRQRQLRMSVGVAGMGRSVE